MLYIANASDLADLFKNFLGISFVLQTDEVVADSLKKKMPRNFYAIKSADGQVSICFRGHSTTQYVEAVSEVVAQDEFVVWDKVVRDKTLLSQQQDLRAAIKFNEYIACLVNFPLYAVPCLVHRAYEGDTSDSFDKRPFPYGFGSERNRVLSGILASAVYFVVLLTREVFSHYVISRKDFRVQTTKRLLCCMHVMEPVPGGDRQ